jgi:hypothetical protein
VFENEQIDWREATDWATQAASDFSQAHLQSWGWVRGGRTAMRKKVFFLLHG